jgi:hypothetical protein
MKCGARHIFGMFFSDSEGWGQIVVLQRLGPKPRPSVARATVNWVVLD